MSKCSLHMYFVHSFWGFLVSMYLVKELSWVMSCNCWACDSCIRSITQAIWSPSVANFFMASPIEVSSSLLLSMREGRFPVFFLCLRLTTDLATVIGMLDELELDATSAVLVVGRSSGELPLFCEVVGCCIPACSMLLHVIISGQLEQHRFGRNVDFHRDSPGLTSVPVLFVFVLTFKMLHFALTLFYGFLKPLFFI